MNKEFPAQAAREAAGFVGRDGLKRAARRMGYCAREVRRVELHGGGSDRYCRKAAALFLCDPNVFFFAPFYFAAKRAQEAAARTTMATYQAPARRGRALRTTRPDAIQAGQPIGLFPEAGALADEPAGGKPAGERGRRLRLV